MFQIEKSIDTRFSTRKENFGTKMIKTTGFVERTAMNFISKSKTERMLATTHQLTITTTGLPQLDKQNSQLANKTQKVTNLSSRTSNFMSYSSKTQSVYHMKSKENINKASEHMGSAKEHLNKDNIEKTKQRMTSMAIMTDAVSYTPANYPEMGLTTGNNKTALGHESGTMTEHLSTGEATTSSTASNSSEGILVSNWS